MKYKILSKDKRTIMSVFFKMSNGKKNFVTRTHSQFLPSYIFLFELSPPIYREGRLKSPTYSELENIL